MRTKRYVYEIANDILRSIPAGPAKDEKREMIEKYIKACEAGLITPRETVQVIVR